MTIERRLARAGFTLTRDYPAPVKRVWDAFADEDQKLAWWGAGDAIQPGEWAFDFRVGGRDVAEGTFHNGPVSRYEATYTDIVEHVRIVTTYDMWLDRIHMSTSVASLELLGSPTSSTASSSTSSGQTGRTAKKEAGACSRHWATTSRSVTPALVPWLNSWPEAH
jgi:uncharacterized protein YndB with AHSA1/START domain